MYLKVIGLLLVANVAVADVTFECAVPVNYPDNTPYVAKFYNIQVDGVKEFSTEKSQYVADMTKWKGKVVNTTCSTVNSGGEESNLSNVVKLDFRKPPNGNLKVRVKISATSEIVLE